MISFHLVTQCHRHAPSHKHTCAHVLAVDFTLCRVTALGHLPCPLKGPLTGAALIKAESGNAVVESAEGGGKPFRAKPLWTKFLVFQTFDFVLDKTKRYLQKRENEKVITYVF